MITDWDDAYANGAYIPDADSFVAHWQGASTEFRAHMLAAGRAEIGVSYGPHPREALDIYHPEGPPKGLMIFVHGGYWRAFDRHVWAHLAAGAVARGWAVAIPGYVLCPEVRIGDITRQIAAAVDLAATKIPGPVHLCGHSAGGHLVARMGCLDVDLACATRIKRITPISGLFDLRPLLRTEMNADFGMDMTSAMAESPALLTPREGFDLTCWVGAKERPEFLRQNALLANIWSGFLIETTVIEAKNHNHFTVISDLCDPQSPLTHAVIG
ncbi:MAG: alpha/beta hydrolase [Paracoccaceae bacterium]